MRIAIFSDVHANLPSLEAALRDVSARGCDRVINLGDGVAIGPFPAETLDVLLADGIPSLKGNYEQYLLTRC